MDPLLLILVLMALCGVAWLIVVYRKDRRRERARTRDAISPAVREAIEQERAAAMTRRAKFHMALKDAEAKDPKSS